MYIKRQLPQKRDTDDEDWSIFFYNPSLAASVLFSILYMIPLVYHTYISYIAHKKTSGKYFRYSYSAPIIIAAVIEINGYAERAASTQSTQDIGLFASSQTMIVLAPVLVCASLYVLLGRIIRSTCTLEGQARDWDARGRGTGIGTRREEAAGEAEKRPDVKVGGIVRVSYLPKIFITLDVAAMLTQGGGSAIAASGEWKGTMKDIGTGVLIGGLALQVATFAVFLSVVVAFHQEILRHGEEGMKMVLQGVYIAGLFIMIRSIFRLIEFALGTESYVMTHEWPLYVLEAVPMLIAFMVLGWYHPSRWISVEGAGVSKARAWYERYKGGFFT
ncbi:RTA1 like protein-domain-containing protein [Aspergillus falconensis]